MKVKNRLSIKVVVLAAAAVVLLIPTFANPGMVRNIIDSTWGFISGHPSGYCSHTPVPAYPLVEEAPPSDWTAIKSEVFVDLKGSTVTIKLFSQSDSENEGEVVAFLFNGKTSYEIGLISSYGPKDVYIFTESFGDGLPWSVILRGRTGEYAWQTVIAGQSETESGAWHKLLTAGSGGFEDVDQDGVSEFVEQREGDLPSNVIIYQWDGNRFTKLDVAAVTGNTYAYTYFPPDNVITSLIESGRPGGLHYFRLEEDTLVEIKDSVKLFNRNVLPGSFHRLLTEEDIDGLTPEQLDIMRNGIYAKYGRVFEEPELDRYFSSMQWYVKNLDFKEEDMSISDGKNADIIAQRSLEMKKFYDMIENGSTVLDMNGDGQNDTVLFECQPGGNTFTLRINGSFIEGRGVNLDGVFFISDINAQDNIKEIAIPESGPSDDMATTFYCYDGKDIIAMGKLPGSRYEIEINGTGTLKTTARGRILHTWFHDASFTLIEGHRLQNVPQELYNMNCRVRLVKDLTLQKDPMDSGAALIIKAGEYATILASDDVEWCLVEDSKGGRGWFAVEKYSIIKGTGMHASEVFEGLCYAD
ncbi:MAG: YARHG domain-containing protein [Clostridiales bacterium]|nr:YARHG domain-containing protein [Clostridiales bacterium]